MIVFENLQLIYIFEIKILIKHTLFIALTAFIAPSRTTTIADLSFPDTINVDLPAAFTLSTDQVTPATFKFTCNRSKEFSVQVSINRKKTRLIDNKKFTKVIQGRYLIQIKLNRIIKTFGTFNKEEVTFILVFDVNLKSKKYNENPFNFRDHYTSLAKAWRVLRKGENTI